MFHTLTAGLFLSASVIILSKSSDFDVQWNERAGDAFAILETRAAEAETVVHHNGQYWRSNYFPINSTFTQHRRITVEIETATSSVLHSIHPLCLPVSYSGLYASPAFTGSCNNWLDYCAVIVLSFWQFRMFSTVWVWYLQKSTWIIFFEDFQAVLHHASSLAQFHRAVCDLVAHDLKWMKGRRETNRTPSSRGCSGLFYRSIAAKEIMHYLQVHT